MVGVIVQHLVEWQAHAVIVVPDTLGVLVPSGTTSIHPIDCRGAERCEGCFQWPSHREGLKDWQYPRWAMRAYEVGFSSTC